MNKLKIIATLILCGLMYQSALAQYLEDTNTYDLTDSVDVIHYNEIRLTPGFWAQAGSDVHVYIDTSLIHFTPVPGGLVQSVDTSQISGHNYVYTVFMREPELDKDNLGAKERIETINYLDGLGRPSQSITIQGSPNNKDIIQPIDYDDFGREKLKYLSYTASSNTGEFVDDAITDCKSFYSGEITGHESDNTPFSEVLFDNSPLNRVTGEKGVGTNFHGDSTDIQYLTNTSPVDNWSVSGDPASYSTDNFAANQLYLTEFTDENDNTTREYKDKLGRVVCKAADSGNGWLNTYYVYDDFGLLRCVVPPKASDPNTDKELCYYYTYDHRKRMIEKDLPGAEPVYMVYDARDRLVMVQDGNNRNLDQWQFSVYDNLNRPVKTGIVDSQHEHGTVIDNFDGVVSFPTGTYPTTNFHTQTYYDDYDFVDGLDKYSFDEYDTGGLGVEESLLTKSMPTGSIINVIKNNDDVILKSSLLSVTYYDKYGRPSRVISDNHLGGIDVVDNLHNFAGEITQTLLRHNVQTGGNLLTTLTTFDYDHQGRLITEKMKLNDGQNIIVAAYLYNELGEQIAKYLHGNEATEIYNQKVDYTYNIKGWLSNINKGTLDEDNDLFALNLQYNDGTSGFQNGNIWKMDWINTGDVLKNYTFAYDGVNRLKTADYSDGINDGDFKTSYAYDANGNLDSLNRHVGGNLIDELAYQYKNGGNQLLSVTDNGTAEGYAAGTGDYTYDLNGNMIGDPSKSTEVLYNHLNLPRMVSANSSDDNIRYVYSANGVKLRKAVVKENFDDEFFDYVGPFFYENDVLKAIFTSAGRIVPVDDNGEVLYQFEYNLQDHLGNIRVVFGGNDNGRPELLQTTDYYPFGMTMSQQNYFDTDVLANKYLYNDKELQDDEVAGVKLDWYDYGARFYDPQLGRWHVPDALAEWDFSRSPYNYVSNNPMRYIDPDGNFKTKFGAFLYKIFNGGGKILQDKNKDSKTYIEYFVSRRKESKGDADITVKRVFKPGRTIASTVKKRMQSRSGRKKPYGERWTMIGGQGRESAKAETYGPGGDISDIMSLRPEAGAFSPSALSITNAINSFYKSIKEASSIKVTSDKAILEEHGGNSPSPSDMVKVKIIRTIDGKIRWWDDDGWERDTVITKQEYDSLRTNKIMPWSDVLRYERK